MGLRSLYLIEVAQNRVPSKTRFQNIASLGGFLALCLAVSATGGGLGPHYSAMGYAIVGHTLAQELVF